MSIFIVVCSVLVVHGVVGDKGIDVLIVDTGNKYGWLTSFITWVTCWQRLVV